MSGGSVVCIVAIWAAVAACGWSFAPILIILAPAAYYATQSIVEHDQP